MLVSSLTSPSTSPLMLTHIISFPGVIDTSKSILIHTSHLTLSLLASRSCSHLVIPPTFYTYPNQEPTPHFFRSSWLLALGDLARLRAKSKSQMSIKSSSDHPTAWVDNSPSPSIGVVAVRMISVELEKEHWRKHFTWSCASAEASRSS
ncbi:uncharacterized protein F5147DRAFT_776762 [Suillus discolor]|uniref:Uncharacterized protein n=1 Tax=Suillus discolor TaxID=1912936 RepID=A0A9P7JRD6_9AGAM|nr:uncharacterized protein F5147DRAFT_776762 [Suillus discolor]KAG2101031.1 hypothetical protein F5147DRAFT_776762 [Suillus discolor]